MLKNKRIIITGGNGFLGRHIVELLKSNNEVFIPSRIKYNLINQNIKSVKNERRLNTLRRRKGKTTLNCRF